LAVLSVIVVAIIVLVAVLIAGNSSDNGPSTPVDQSGRQAAALFKGIPVQGNMIGDADAAHTLSIFGDLQCPFCAEFDTQAMPTLINKYVRQGKLKVNFYLLDFLGPDSKPAAEAAYAAGDQQFFWPYVNTFYHQQGEENSGYVTPAFLRGLAAAIPGLDVTSWQQDLQQNRSAHAKQLRSNQAAERRLGVSSTPTFFLTDDKTGQTHLLSLSSLDAPALVTALKSAGIN